MTEKKYSVLMSVYDKERAEYLTLSIESVMKQTIMPDEFVIVCDGRLNDGLEQVLKQYVSAYPQMFVIVRLEENKGLGVALNEGIKRCKNNLVARMDSDDICMPDRMERQLDVIEREKADVVSGTVLEFVGNTDNIIAKRVPPHTKAQVRKFARRRNPFNHPAVMYRKDCVMSVGGYEHFPLFEDYHLWIRMLLKGYEGYNIEEPVLYMRSGDSMYKRRGGIRYAGYVYKFRRFVYKSGYSDIRDFAVSAGGHIIIALLPVAIRRKIYERMLRN